jgi:hypothetical protein
MRPGWLQEIIVGPLASRLLALVILAWRACSYAGPLGDGNSLEKIYSDESHCLVAPEIRGETDDSISCFCRDAITDARYVVQNYFTNGKDRKLVGVVLTLWDHARRMCGAHFDALEATEAKDWRWSGPEVTRDYPPDSEIDQIPPDSHGFRSVRYSVRLTYRDPGGRVTRVENFTALDLFPPNPRK